MGNQNNTEGQKQAESYDKAQKIVLRLRYRDIILHYALKMKVSISDIDIFPSHFEGLRLWDTDVVLSRFIILENERFKGKDVMVFKAGVGIAGVALSKWAGCKSITICDMNEEVVKNMKRNCEMNQAKDVKSLFLKLHEFDLFPESYDVVLSTDLFGQGFNFHNVLNIWRKLLRVGGSGYMIIADKKELAKKFLQGVDRTEFKISSLVLTADEYEASPLFNKIVGESQFPLLGKSTFYSLSLTKLRHVEVRKEEANAELQIKKEDNVDINQRQVSIKKVDADDKSSKKDSPGTHSRNVENQKLASELQRTDQLKKEISSKIQQLESHPSTSQQKKQEISLEPKNQEIPEINHHTNKEQKSLEEAKVLQEDEAQIEGTTQNVVQIVTSPTKEEEAAINVEDTKDVVAVEMKETEQAPQQLQQVEPNLTE